MNRIFDFFLIFFILIAVFFTGTIFYFKQKNPQLISPVLGASKMRIADNQWFPLWDKITNFGSSEVEDLSSQAAFFIETQTGEVLFEKNSQKKLRIASLVKIMTAIIALENKDFSDNYVISERAANMEPDKMLLIAGETLTLEELLDGIFLVSANDASETIAEGTTGRREEFLTLMNSKAKQLGMNNTLFLNPSGLEEDDPNYPPNSGNLTDQYSTAFDVSLMSRYAINRWPKLLEISSQPHINIPQTKHHQDYDLYSGINLLTTYPGVIGFKTGFTPEAGLTLVTVARRGDKQVLGVLLGATNRRDDAKLLLDHSFKKLGLEVEE